MPRDILEYNESQIVWTLKDVLIGLFIRPVKTLNYIVKTYFNNYITLLVMLMAVLFSLEDFLEDDFLELSTVLINLVLYPILIWIPLYFSSHIYVIVGRLFKGVGDFHQMLLVQCYSLFPLGVAAVFNIIILYSHRIFTSNIASGVQYNSKILPSGFLSAVIMAFSSIAAIYSLYLVVLGISKAHKISLLKAFICFCLPSLAMLIILFSVFSLAKLASF